MSKKVLVLKESMEEEQRSGLLGDDEGRNGCAIPMDLDCCLVVSR